MKATNGIRGRLLTTFLIVSVSRAATGVTIETVPVGNSGNIADPRLMIDGTSGYGAVGYDFRIGKYEVTNAQYVEFLNGVDPLGVNALGLYHPSMTNDANGGINRSTIAPNGQKYSVRPGRALQPVTWVGWHDAVRFANWMHNGQGSGDTESGSYTLDGLDGPNVVRIQEASWVLPTEHEWYKAAYHKNDGPSGNYWAYPTTTDAVPYSDFPGTGAPDPANTANFYKTDGMLNAYDNGYAATEQNVLIGTQNYLLNVGSYTSSDSPYGTFDQAGSVAEWTESAANSTERVTRGGGWGSTSALLHANYRGPVVPTANGPALGFRLALFEPVAQVPEPASAILLLVAASGLARRGRRIGWYRE